MKTEKFKKGDEIIKEGSHGTWAYIINSGSVEVSTMINDQKSVLTTLGVKQIFGEMGLIEDKPRSATITAIEDTELQLISRGSFKNLFSKDPTVILPIVRALFERLRIASKMVSTTCSRCGAKLALPDKEIENEDIFEGDDKFIVIDGLNDISKKELNYKPLEIREFPFKVGRMVYVSKLNDKEANLSVQNDLSIKEEAPPYYVSVNHFLIDNVEGEFVIIDRGSRNGFIINNEVVKGSSVLRKDENEIIIGTTFSPYVFSISIKTVAKKFNFDKIDIDVEQVNKTFEAI